MKTERKTVQSQEESKERTKSQRALYEGVLKCQISERSGKVRTGARWLQQE